MPVKIRLQRHGRKGKPFYHIVVADSRSPRDGKFIEKIGTYNPLTSPATIDLDIKQAVTWLKNGAQPTDTTRTILSTTGALYRNHLDTGVSKGAFTAEEAESKFKAWSDERVNKITDRNSSELTGRELAAKVRLEKETQIREERSKALAAKRAQLEQASVESEAPVEGASLEASPKAEYQASPEVSPEATAGEEGAGPAVS